MQSNYKEAIGAIVGVLTAPNGKEHNRALENLIKVYNELDSLVAPCAETGAVAFERVVEDVLLELGMPDTLLGYRYCVKAIEFIYTTGGDVYVTKEVYPHVARVCDTTVYRVERAVRYAIECAIMRCEPNIYTKIFSNSISPDKGKPTNMEFMCRVANYIKRLR